MRDETRLDKAPVPTPATLRSGARGPSPLVVGVGLALLVMSGLALHSGLGRPLVADPRRNLGLAAEARKLLEEGHDDQALVALGKVLGLDPGDADAHRDLGHLYRKRGLGGLAEVEYRTAVSLRPDSVNLIALGLLYLEANKPAEAAREFAAATRVNPTSWVAFLDLGIAGARAGDYAEAARASRRAYELNPESVEALYNLALALRRLGRTEEAIHALEIAVEKRPRWDDAWSNLILARLDAGRIGDARVAIERALEVNPANPVALAEREKLRGAR